MQCKLRYTYKKLGLGSRPEVLLCWQGVSSIWGRCFRRRCATFNSQAIPLSRSRTVHYGQCNYIPIAKQLDTKKRETGNKL